MTRLLDLGIDHIRNIIMDMAKLSENSVFTAIESYEKGVDVKTQIFEWSETLRVLQEEVADLAIELIARYQPIAGGSQIHQILYGDFLWILKVRTLFL